MSSETLDQAHGTVPGAAARPSGGPPTDVLATKGDEVEEWLDLHFPRSIKILDFRHAAEYLGKLAAVYAKEDSRQQWSKWCHLMKHEGGEAIWSELHQLDRRKMSPATQEAHRDVVRYFGNQVHRMDYPSYRAKG